MAINPSVCFYFEVVPGGVLQLTWLFFPDSWENGRHKLLLLATNGNDTTASGNNVRWLIYRLPSTDVVLYGACRQHLVAAALATLARAVRAAVKGNLFDVNDALMLMDRPCRRSRLITFEQTGLIQNGDFNRPSCDCGFWRHFVKLVRCSTSLAKLIATT